MTKKLILVANLLFSSMVVMAQDKKVAVMDPAGSVESSIQEIVREEISSVVVNALGYTVLERSLINKVLEENKFQTGGLVDDSQISEIGKRLGANYVFVSSITIMGNGSYYISCKMIDVLTARIEKQKTAQTQQGANDLINVVQKMVGEMFVNTLRAPDPVVQQKDEPKRKNDPEVEARPMLQGPITYVSICGIEVMTIDLPGEYTWMAAMRSCPEGWRLPTSDELECLCNMKKGISVTGKQYWSSTESRKKRGKAISRTMNDCHEETENMDNKLFCTMCKRLIESESR